MKMTRNEDAVSPVIGVILMVAVTVILAAVIAAFVFGMSGNIQKTHIVAATASVSGSNIVVTYNGGQDASLVNNLTATINGGAFTGTTFTGVPVVGASAITPRAAGTNHIVVTAGFTDNSVQVILDTSI